MVETLKTLIGYSGTDFDYLFIVFALILVVMLVGFLVDFLYLPVEYIKRRGK